MSAAESSQFHVMSCNRRQHSNGIVRKCFNSSWFGYECQNFSSKSYLKRVKFWINLKSFTWNAWIFMLILNSSSSSQVRLEFNSHQNKKKFKLIWGKLSQLDNELAQEMFKSTTAKQKQVDRSCVYVINHHECIFRFSFLTRLFSFWFFRWSKWREKQLTAHLLALITLMLVFKLHYQSNVSMSVLRSTLIN